MDLEIGKPVTIRAKDKDGKIITLTLTLEIGAGVGTMAIGSTFQVAA